MQYNWYNSQIGGYPTGYGPQGSAWTMAETWDTCADTKQSHVHEFEGSTKLAELWENPHNHRFAGVSGPEVYVPGGHVHEYIARTDFNGYHFHCVAGVSGLEVDVGNGKHVHFAAGMTSMNGHHAHEFQYAMMIEDPLSPMPMA